MAFGDENIYCYKQESETKLSTERLLCDVHVQYCTQTSNFSSVIPARGYNIDSLALPQSETIDKTIEAADDAVKQAARE